MKSKICKQPKENFKSTVKNVFLLIAVVFSGSLFAQNKEHEKKVTVPTAVSEAFQKEFPNQKAKWGREGDGYEAEFELNKKEVAAVYDKSGHRKALETAIKITELPSNALQYVNKNYPASKITEATKMTDDKNAVTYEAEIGIKGKKHDVLFDADGKFMKIVESEKD